MLIRVLYHDHCFDGAASAAYFTRFAQETFYPAAEFLYTGMMHKPAQTWDPEVSVDLLNWTRLKSLTDANGTIEFNDDQAAGLPRRFYRLEVHR